MVVEGDNQSRCYSKTIYSLIWISLVKCVMYNAIEENTITNLWLKLEKLQWQRSFSTSDILGKMVWTMRDRRHNVGASK